MSDRATDLVAGSSIRRVALINDIVPAITIKFPDAGEGDECLLQTD